MTTKIALSVKHATVHETLCVRSTTTIPLKLLGIHPVNGLINVSRIANSETNGNTANRIAFR